MTVHTKDICQNYWSNRLAPYLTVRHTRGSTKGYKPHYHSELSIGLIESGATCLSLQDRSIHLKEGDMILIEPEIVHSCNPIGGKPRSYYMLYIEKTWCCKMLSTLLGFEVTDFEVDQNLSSYQSDKSPITNLISALEGEASEEAAIVIENNLISILGRYCSPKQKINSDGEIALKVKELLLQNIEFPPSLNSISAELGQTKENLIRRFKSHFGITPKSFLNNYRVEKAKRLLKSGKPIVDVAIEVGFSDQSQLHKAFVNYTASTPKQYQRT